jgi:hypothetical protein
MTPLARTAGHALALTALVIAFAAAAQAPVYDPHPPAGGFLPWIFAALVAVAIVAVFLFVLWVVQRPSARPPGTARR